MTGMARRDMRDVAGSHEIMYCMILSAIGYRL